MRTVWKPVPCPVYDVAGLQSWLEEMAAEGLLLHRFRLGSNFAVFFGGEPKAVRYRLSATRRLPGLLDSAISDHPDLPDEEEWQLSAAAGWRFVTGLAEFYIYRCEDPAAPELNTDPQVQALSYKYARSNARWRLALALFYLFCYPRIIFRGQFFLFMVEFGWLGAAYLLFLLLFFWDAAANAVRLERLTRRLKQGEAVGSGKDWRQGRGRFFGYRVLTGLVTVLLVASLAALWVSDLPGSREHQTPLQEYTSPLPFATLEDLAEGTFQYQAESEYSHNRVGVYHGPLAPTRYSLEQHGTVRRDSQLVLDGHLYVDYYRAAAPWLARQLAKELPRSSYSKRSLSESYSRDGVEVALYDLDTRLPYLVLRRGSTVMGVRFFCDPSCSLQFEDVLPGIIEAFARQAR